MAKKGEARARITLKCTECGEENFRTEKNKKNTTDRLHSDGKYWIHSGDLGSKDDEGYLYFKGRIKRMIVTNGYNVFPLELESILEKHEFVERACVLGIPDKERIEKVVAFIVLNSGIEKS